VFLEGLSVQVKHKNAALPMVPLGDRLAFPRRSRTPELTLSAKFDVTAKTIPTYYLYGIEAIPDDVIGDEDRAEI
jgi:hypothetical protein